MSYDKSDATIKFRKEPLDLLNVKTSKQVITDKIKVEIIRYESKDPEVLLRMIRYFNNMITTYDLFNKESAPEVFSRFRRCLADNGLDTWLSIITGKNQIKTNFKDSLYVLTRIPLGKDAYNDQVKYLRDTRKPRDINVTSWTRQLKTINSYLELMKKGGKAFTEEELIRQVIAKNAPRVWIDNFKLACGHKCLTVVDCLAKLKLLERKDKARQRAKETRENNKRTGKQGEFRNKCKKNGGHEWYDCPDNLNSRAF